MMGTVSAQPHRDAIYDIADAYASGVVSGIVPDQDHKENGGYHCSIEDLIAFGNGGDYSNRRAGDKAPPVTNTGKGFAAAGDVSMSTADMIKFYSRVRPVYNDQSDPRRKYINAINCWDGSGDAVRLDFQANTVSTASADHKWHNHLDQPRMYIDTARNLAEAQKAARALVSVCTGQTKAAWIAQEEAPDLDATQDKNLTATTERVRSLHSMLTGVTTSWSTQNPTSTDPNLLKLWTDNVNTKLNLILQQLGQLPQTADLATLSGKIDELDAEFGNAVQDAQTRAAAEMLRDAEQDEAIAHIPDEVVAQLAENPDDLAANLKDLMTPEQWADFQASVAAAV